MITSFLLSQTIFCLAGEASKEQYFELIKNYPNLVIPQGDAAKGEIEILLDRDDMEKAQAKTGREVGLVMQDRYWVWMNDACKFPSGQVGVYGRILWRNGLETSRPGVAVMPILPDGRIVLNCNFRHATRSWEIELPRGVRNPNESDIACAERETLEETGMVVDKLIKLGEIPPDSGLTGSIVPIFSAQVVKIREAQPEESEAIDQIFGLTLPEIKQAFVKGYYECKIKDEVQQVHFRDPFLAYAILLYELKANR